jgi:UDP-glucose 4-epimerase
MRVLITGGLGYLGGRISKHLALQGCEVLISSRSVIEAPSWLQGRGQIIPLDLLNPNLDRFGAIDAVIHLAALNEIECAKSPNDALMVNTIGTLKLIDSISKLTGVKRFIYFSTAHVYRAPLLGRIDETTTTRPTHPYAYSHRASEDLVFSFEGKAFRKGCVIRLSNGFGYPERASVNRWTLLVNDLCKQIATDGQIKLTSNGTQLRDFIGLEDVARATKHLLDLDEVDLADGLFNVGSGKAITVYEMASLVRDVACEYMNRDLPPVERLAPDISKSSQSLDYNCSKLAKTGFTCTSDWRHEIKETLKVCIAVVKGG